MLRARKINNADEAVACLRAVDDSGLERVEWAKRNGIDARSLNAWRLNLGWPRPARLVELVADEAVVEPNRGTARYVVRVGQLGVEVGDDFEEGTLRRLLAVVSSC
jgi:hypothetical protein